VLAAAQTPSPNATTLAEQRDIKMTAFPGRLQNCVTTKTKTEPDLSKALDACVDLQEDTYITMIMAAAANSMAAAANSAVSTVQVAADEARPDKQTGSSSSSSGSTSLVSKGSASDVLGFAVEAGALTKTTSGTTMTFTARPLQVIQAFQKLSWSESYQKIDADKTLGFLNRFSFGATFDTSRGSTNGVFTGSTNQVSAFLAHVDLLNWRDPRSKRFDGKWETLRTGAFQEMTTRLSNAINELDQNVAYRAAYKEWKGKLIDSIVGEPAKLTDLATTALSTFPLDKVPKDAIKAAADATTTVLNARASILDYVGTSPIISLDYTDSFAVKAVSPAPQLPDLSNLKLIVETAPFHGGSFTVNASATMFNSRPVGFSAKRFRDAQAAVQLDIPIKSAVATLGNALITFAGKFEHIASDTLPATPVGIPTSLFVDDLSSTGAALKGNLALLQAKLTIPIKNTGVKIPLSVSWANRTELIKESDMRGNIGITFDMDTIIGLLKK